jgi:hypothetical protein
LIKQTNKYTLQQIAQCDTLFTFHFWIGQWKDVILAKMYTVIALLMLPGLLHKHKGHITTRTTFCIFLPSLKYLHSKDVCFSDNSALRENEGSAELFSIYRIIQYPNYNFQQLYKPNTDTATDKSFIL